MPTAHHSNPRTGTPGLDARFLRGVQWISVILAAVFGGFTAMYIGLSWGAGFFCAGLWSAANFWALERLMRAAVRPEGRDPMTIAVIGVVKIVVLYGLLFAMLKFGDFPIASVLIGMSLPLLVIFLKALGRTLGSKTATMSTGRDPSTPQPRS